MMFIRRSSRTKLLVAAIATVAAIAMFTNRHHSAAYIDDLRKTALFPYGADTPTETEGVAGVAESTRTAHPADGEVVYPPPSHGTEQQAKPRESSEVAEKQEHGHGKAGPAGGEDAPPETLFDFGEAEIRAIHNVSTERFLSGDPHAQGFFGKLFDLVLRNEMSHPLKRRQGLDGNGKPHIDNVHFKSDPDEILSEEQLLRFFDFPPEFVDDLTVKHANVLNSLPDYVPGFYAGDGYAIVGGGHYSWYSLLAVKCLRIAGAVLPVEVILPTHDDYEPLLCETMLPLMNARCVDAENIFGKHRLDQMKISGYQLKSLALLASSFRNVFLMDSDSYVVTNPEPLFKSELFKMKHMLAWPDFWRRTTSPVYYQIAGINVTDEPVRHLNDVFTDINKMHLFKTEDPNFNVKKDVSFHDRGNTLIDWSSESGQLLVNKDIHFKTLLLAFYYNRDGPFGYHPLLSQGGAGEGDKETFVAAASRLNLPYYQVYKKSDGAYGFWNLLNSFEHGAIIQYDPVTDSENVVKAVNRIKHDQKEQGDQFVYDYSKYFIEGIRAEESKPLFYHCHDPKFDPYLIRERNIMFVREHGKILEKRRRVLGEDFPRGDVDLELNLWEIADDYLCRQKLHFSIFDGKDKDILCKEYIPEQLDFLRKSHDYIVEHYNPDTSRANLDGSNDVFGEKQKGEGETAATRLESDALQKAEEEKQVMENEAAEALEQVKAASAAAEEKAEQAAEHRQKR